MQDERDMVFDAGRLLQWGLRAKARPVQEPEYHQLMQRYFDTTAFRATVRHLAEGLGLEILDANEHGLFLSPQPDSVFAFRAADFRPGKSSAEERLLVGLVQVAIAATIFPRQRDLEEPAHVARQPVTVEEIDQNIRTICEHHAQSAVSEGDLPTDEVNRGMEEAWRIYRKRVAVAQTKSGGEGRKTTHHLIRQTLDRFVELGCFTREGEDPPRYRATMRYQVAVRELAAGQMFKAVQEALATGSKALLSAPEVSS